MCVCSKFFESFEEAQEGLKGLRPKRGFHGCFFRRCCESRTLSDIFVYIRPNTLVGGRGSIKTTLYDLCLRSTTVVQGFPAVHSFCTESPETRRGFLLSGAGSLGWVGAGFLRPQWITTPPSPLRKVPDHSDTLVCFCVSQHQYHW